MTTSDLDTPPVAGQRLTSDGDYMLFLMEWEKKDDDALSWQNGWVSSRLRGRGLSIQTYWGTSG